jgi:hypothetical protein
MALISRLNVLNSKMIEMSKSKPLFPFSSELFVELFHSWSTLGSSFRSFQMSAISQTSSNLFLLFSVFPVSKCSLIVPLNPDQKFKPRLFRVLFRFSAGNLENKMNPNRSITTEGQNQPKSKPWKFDNHKNGMIKETKTRCTSRRPSMIRNVETWSSRDSIGDTCCWTSRKMKTFRICLIGTCKRLWKTLKQILKRDSDVRKLHANSAIFVEKKKGARSSTVNFFRIACRIKSANFIKCW